MELQIWRQRVAALVDEHLIEINKGRYPSTVREMIACIDKLGYRVIWIDSSITQHAITLLNERIVAIPVSNNERMVSQLLHEAAEIMLRLPLEPELTIPPTTEDEYHNVASITAMARQGQHHSRLRRIPVR